MPLSKPKTLSDLPPDQFRILGTCSNCSYVGWLDHDQLTENSTVSEQQGDVACKACGSSDFVVRFIYLGNPGQR